MNTRKSWMLSIVAAGLLLAALLAAGPAQAQIGGAIFTTVADGTRVNANIYQNKEDVYLDGGPGPNAPSKAAGLQEGDYYFQVTDPPGKVLLSTDAIECRRIHVNGSGVIDYVYPAPDPKKTHATGVDADHAELGAITVQLMPYRNTPNNGGVYKVWVTPVEKYGAVDEGSFGFIPAFSKTDNFKVRGKAPLIPITVRKFHDKNANGTWDDGEEEIVGWKVAVTDPVGSGNVVYSPATVAACAGKWTLTEDRPSGTLVTASIVDGVPLVPPQDSVDVPVVGTAGETHEVVFGNVGLGQAGPRPKFYDRNCNGNWDAPYVDLNDNRQWDPGEPLLAGAEPVIPGFMMKLTLPDGSEIDQPTDEYGCATFGNLPPGEYTLGEILPSGGGWVPWEPIPIVIESTLSYSPAGEPLLAGTDARKPIGNYRIAWAAFSTKGYWHNKNGLTELNDDDVAYANGLDPYHGASSYFNAGDEPFDGLFSDGTPVEAAHGDWGEEVAPAGSWQAEVSHFLIDSNAGGDPCEQLAQQLLAFAFNCRHRLDEPGAAIQLPDGSWVPASDLIDAAIAAWLSPGSDNDQLYQGLLDLLNNNNAVAYVCFGPGEIVYP